jgi:hypothetical protein
MEIEIAQLVSEVFVCQQTRDIQQEQLTRDNAAAVRDAILVHARPILHDDAPLGCEQLSASNWKRISSFLAGLMPIFWFSVIKGFWGSVKVIVHPPCGYAAMPIPNFDLHSIPQLFSSRAVAATSSPAHPGRTVLIMVILPPAASKEWVGGLLRKWHACTPVTLAYWRTSTWPAGGAQ